jgi:glutamate carboxypeptidase
MRALVESQYDQFISDLETLVNIDSGSESPDGLMAIRDFLLKRLSRLGWRTVTHNFADGKVPCLEAVSPGAVKMGDRYDFLFLGHMDTVFGEGTAAKRPFSLKNKRAMGPGVCDMKAGLVTMLHVAEVISRKGLAEDLGVCVGFNSDEEVGSKGSREWLEALARRSSRVFVFEPCRATGPRILHRKGGGVFDIFCHGKAAHAGAAPEKGANAVAELARQVVKITGFGQPDLGTSVNVTVISGGTADNVIPDFAKASVDVRFSNVDEARRVEECFRQVPESPSTEGVRVEVKGAFSRMPMVPSDQTERLWGRIADIGQDIGLDMKLTSTGGCSDGNFTAAMGIPTIDALGPIGGDAHSEDEYVELDSIVPNTLLICEVLKAAAEGSLP